MNIIYTAVSTKI